MTERKKALVLVTIRLRMTTQKKNKLRKLISRYKWYIIAALALAVLCVVGALAIYHYFEEADHLALHKLADFLVTLAETILGAGIIGGGIGGGINFIFEEMRTVEEDKEKRKVFRREMQNKLQVAYDNVEMARVLIKTHQSAKTYGEQIRNRIMPSLISLQDFKRRLDHLEDDKLRKNLDYFQVSLNYMIAYLSVLVKEFENSYLDISNLQNYQETLTSRMRALFTEITEGNKVESISLQKKKEFLKNVEEKFELSDVPSHIEVVWQAIKELDYIQDFIDDLRYEKGIKSKYNEYFLQHYKHCNQILKTKASNINPDLCALDGFIKSLDELKRIDRKKKDTKDDITHRDNLARFIMENELDFDFETHNMKKAKPITS